MLILCRTFWSHSYKWQMSMPSPVEIMCTYYPKGEQARTRLKPLCFCMKQLLCARLKDEPRGDSRFTTWPSTFTRIMEQRWSKKGLLWIKTKSLGIEFIKEYSKVDGLHCGWYVNTFLWKAKGAVEQFHDLTPCCDEGVSFICPACMELDVYIYMYIFFFWLLSCPVYLGIIYCQFHMQL